MTVLRIFLLAFLLLGLGLLAWMSAGQLLEPEAEVPQYAAPLVLGVLMVSVVIAYSWITVAVHVSASEDSPQKLGPLDVSDGGLDYFEPLSDGGMLDPDAALAFVDAAIYPRTVFERITESAESWHRSVVLRSTYTVAINVTTTVNERPDYVIPLFFFRKGQIQDGLRVFDGGDRRVSTLSSTDVVTYELAVMRSLISALGPVAYRSYLSSVEPEVERLVVSGEPPSTADVTAVTSSINLLSTSPRDVDLIKAAVAFVETVSLHLPVCVTVPVSEVAKREWPWTFRFRIEHRMVPPLQIRSGWFDHFVSWLRLAVGVRVNRLEVPLTNSTRTPSYHLQIAGPEGTYLAHQYLFGLSEERGSTVRVQPRRGQRRAHLYLRGVGAHNHHPGAAFQVQFFERAPGSFAGPAFAALFLAAVVYVVALTRVPDLRGLIGLEFGAVDLSSGVVTLLLTVPIAVLAWRPGRVPLHPSLWSRVLSGFILLASLVTFMGTAIGVSSKSQGGDAFWLFLASAATLLFLLSVGSWFLRLTIEYRLVVRRDVGAFEGDEPVPSVRRTF